MTASVKFKFLAQCHKCEFHCYFFIVGREILAVSWLCLKYQYASRTLCAYAHVFRKRPGCALIGACALIRMNTIRQIHQENMSQKYIYMYIQYKESVDSVPTKLKNFHWDVKALKKKKYPLQLISSVVSPEHCILSRK